VHHAAHHPSSSFFEGQRAGEGVQREVKGVQAVQRYTPCQTRATSPPPGTARATGR